MSKAVTTVTTAAVLAGPTAIAFFAGGFFDDPRLIAGLAACALLLAAALLAERPLPRRWPGRLALGAVAGLALWSALSLAWAPLGGPAIDDVQRLVLYALALAAASAWLRPAVARAAAEPALGLGAFAVVGYGLSERMLPGLLEFERSAAAGGRLEQPLTYWNGMGIVAVVGLVLCARLAATRNRPPALRALGSACAPVLAAGLYLTFSRGALAALAVGMLALLAFAPDRAQARALAVAGGAGGLAALVCALLPQVHSVDGGAGQGAALLATLVGLGASAAVLQVRLSRLEASGRLPVTRLEWRRAGTAFAVLAVGAGLAAAVAAGGGSDAGHGVGSDPSRLRSLQSSRYDYWRVALDSFAGQPLRGVGASGFRVEWQRERNLPESARDAHSLYIETAAELGLVGVLLLGALFAGVAGAARRALARAPAMAAGPAAALTAWAFHAGLDWDWELPAVTLPAIALSGLLIALGDDGPGQDAAGAGSAALEPARRRAIQRS
jgi:hypothetical protein